MCLAGMYARNMYLYIYVSMNLYIYVSMCLCIYISMFLYMGCNNLQWKLDCYKLREWIIRACDHTGNWIVKMVKSSYWYSPTITYINLITLELYLTLSSASSGSSLPIQIKLLFFPGQLYPAHGCSITTCPDSASARSFWVETCDYLPAGHCGLLCGKKNKLW